MKQRYKMTVVHNTFSDVAKPVALIRATGETVEDALERMFRVTNSVDMAWYDVDYKDNPNIEVRNLFKGMGCRSTSVDDLVVVHHTSGLTSKSIQVYRVADCGFEEVELDDVIKMKATNEANNEWLTYSMPVRVLIDLAFNRTVEAS